MMTAGQFTIKKSICKELAVPDNSSVAIIKAGNWFKIAFSPDPYNEFARDFDGKKVPFVLTRGVELPLRGNLTLIFSSNAESDLLIEYEFWKQDEAV